MSYVCLRVHFFYPFSPVAPSAFVGPAQRIGVINLPSLLLSLILLSLSPPYAARPKTATVPALYMTAVDSLCFGSVGCFVFGSDGTLVGMH